MVDADVLEDLKPATVPTRAQILSDLLHHGEIDLYRYSEQGPPVEVKPVQFPGGSIVFQPAFEGWVVVNGWDETTRQGLVSFVSGAKTLNTVVLLGNRVGIAADDTASECYLGLGAADARARRYADQLGAEVAAQGLRADLYVTRRQYLSTEFAMRLNRELTVCTPEQALPLVGLYLRAHGEYLPLRRISYSRHLFFWVAARELLPSGWRWFNAVVAHDERAGDPSLTYLAQSAFQRVSRALEARDAVLIAMNRPQNRETGETALAHVDTMLLFLMGAVDVMARVAHRILKFRSDEYQARWQSDSWLEQVLRVAPHLAAVVAPSTSNHDVLTILRLMRNSVHGEALRGLSHQRRDVLESLIGLPRRDEAEVLKAMTALGGLESWSVRTFPFGTYSDPAVLADKIFGLVISLLDALMANTPVERLVGVDFSNLRNGPPESTSGQWPSEFDLAVRRAIRDQLGIDDGSAPLAAE